MCNTRIYQTHLRRGSQYPKIAMVERVRPTDERWDNTLAEVA